MQDLNTIVTAAESLTSAELDGEYVLLDVESGRYYGLNRTGKHILDAAQHGASVAAIIDELISEYDVDRGTLQDDVVHFVSEMKAQGLVKLERPAESG